MSWGTPAFFVLFLTVLLSPGGDPRRPITGVALPMWSMVAFLDHNWNKRFSTATGYSMLDIDNSNGQAPNAFQRGHYGLANLLFYRVDNAMVGGEFQWGRRENFLDGFKSDDFASRFRFATTCPSYSHIESELQQDHMAQKEGNNSC